MNIAFFLIPKNNVAYLHDDNSLRQGLEKMKYHGYTAIPVLSRDNKYVGTVSEGDFLRYFIGDNMNNLSKPSAKNIESDLIKDVLNIDKTHPVPITATIEELLLRSMNQNFIPVTDDLGSFVGIVTRKDIIKYFYDHYVSEPEQFKNPQQFKRAQY